MTPVIEYLGDTDPENESEKRKREPHPFIESDEDPYECAYCFVRRKNHAKEVEP